MQLNFTVARGAGRENATEPRTAAIDVIKSDSSNCVEQY